MMDEQRYQNADEVIDLVDLLFYLLKKWKSFLILLVIGALLGSGVCALKAVQTRNAAVAASQTEWSAAGYDIDDEVIAQMEMAAQYRKQYLEQLAYCQNSILMQLDPNAFYEGRLTYYISAGDDTTLAVSRFQNIIKSDDILDELLEASGLDCEASYIEELLSASTSAELINRAPEETKSAMTDIYNYSGETSESNTIIIKVVAPDEESCSQMLSVLREKAEELDSECASSYEIYNSVKVSDSVQQTANSAYLTWQDKSLSCMYTYLTNEQKLEDAFTSTELDYYKHVYYTESLDETETVAAVEVETTAEADTDTEVSLSFSGMKKYVLIGAVVGLFLWACWFGLSYLLDKSIRTYGEAKDCYRVPMLGRLAADDGKARGIDGMIDALYCRIKGSADTIPYVISAINTIGDERTVLCGNIEYEEVQAVMEEFQKNCAQIEIDDFAGKSVHALERVKETGREILVVRIGKTKKAEIRRELEICRMQKIKVVGMVAIENI
ncbi:MAG: hypothetical protein LUE24_10415 [Lachnospiraceae bacterium]|nr:hypothetical protein [Lachnospiraceae bacterium]